MVKKQREIIGTDHGIEIKNKANAEVMVKFDLDLIKHRIMEQFEYKIWIKAWDGILVAIWDIIDNEVSNEIIGEMGLLNDG